MVFRYNLIINLNHYGQGTNMYDKKRTIQL